MVVFAALVVTWATRISGKYVVDVPGARYSGIDDVMQSDIAISVWRDELVIQAKTNQWPDVL